MRGFIRLRTLITLLVLAAAGIAAVAYGRMGLAYYRIKQECIEVANSGLSLSISDRDAIERLITKVQQRTGITLTRSDVVIRRDRAKATVSVEIRTALPVEFPLVNQTIYRPALIRVEAERIKDY